MRKSDFYGQHKVSKEKPVEFAKKDVDPYKTALTIKEFLDENFRGLCNTICEAKAQFRLIRISEDYTAYFLRTMLSFVHGRSVVDLVLTVNEREFFIIVKGNGGLPFTPTEMNTLMRISRMAGFTPSLKDDALILEVDMTYTTIGILSAISVNTFRQKLYEIFYTGMH